MLHNKSPFPKPKVLPSIAAHTHTIIFLHGRGSSGDEFATELFSSLTGKKLGSPSLPEQFGHTKWVFPSSRTSYMRVFQEEQPQWFDIPDVKLEEVNPADEELRASVQHVREIVQAEIDVLGGAAERVALGGISQGMAVGLVVLIDAEFHTRLGAFVGWNGWLPSPYEEAERGSQDAVQCPSPRPEAAKIEVYLGHTEQDYLVDVELGRRACGSLRTLGMEVLWNEFQGDDHWIKEPEGMESMIAFLKRRGFE